MTKPTLSCTEYDLVIIGAGFCGSAIGIMAAKLGLSIRVIDRTALYPDHFRAEKLEPDQHEALEEFDLLRLVQPEDCHYIDQVHEIKGATHRIVECEKHRGMDYSATVNRFRSVAQLRENLDIRNVTRVSDTPGHCEIAFDDGTRIRGRHGVIATGMSGALRESLGLAPVQPGAMLSTTFGFDIKPSSNGQFPCEAFNFRPEKSGSGLQFATFFPVGDRTRVNVFTCWRPRSPAAKRLRADANAGIHNLFPTFDQWIGAFELCSPVQMYTTRYFRQDCSHLNSTLIVGDAYQSVSPATGIGLSKCVTDARVVLRLLRNRDSESSIPAEYYADAGKQKVDDAALRRWQSVNEISESRTLRSRLRGFKRRLVSSGPGRMLASIRTRND